MMSLWVAWRDAAIADSSLFSVASELAHVRPAKEGTGGGAGE